VGLAAARDAWTVSPAVDGGRGAPKAGAHPQGRTADLPRTSDAASGLSQGTVASAELVTADQGEVMQDLEAEAALGADLSTAFSPFDRARMERALDGFLEELATLDVELARVLDSNHLLPKTMLVASALALGEVLRRKLRRGRDDRTGRGEEGDDDEAGLPGFPGLPGRREWELA
jgi:hypothetical protein